MVVYHREQVSLAELALMDDAGAVHAVGLPHVVDELGLETSPVLGQAGVLVQPVPPEQPVQAVLRGHLVRGDDAARTGELQQHRKTHRGILAPQCDEGCFQFRAQRPAGTPVLPRLWRQRFQPLSPPLVQEQPPQYGRPRDRRPGGAGDFPGHRGYFPNARFLFPPAHAFPAHQGADEAKAEEGDPIT